MFRNLILLQPIPQTLRPTQPALLHLRRGRRSSHGGAPRHRRGRLRDPRQPPNLTPQVLDHGREHRHADGGAHELVDNVPEQQPDAPTAELAVQDQRAERKPHGRDLGHDDERDQLHDLEALHEAVHEERRVRDAVVYHGEAHDVDETHCSGDERLAPPEDVEPVVVVRVAAPAAALREVVRQGLWGRGFGDGGRDEQRAQVAPLVQELEGEAPVGAEILDLVEDDGVGEDRGGVHADRVRAFRPHRDHRDAPWQTGDFAPETLGAATDKLAEGVLRL